MADQCVGCGGPDPTERLYLAAPLGLCSVLVHRDRACAEAAREKRGGGRFVPEPKSKEDRIAEEKAKLAAARAPEPDLPPILRPGWTPPSRRLL